jgi:hypothetical protein
MISVIRYRCGIDVLQDVMCPMHQPTPVLGTFIFGGKAYRGTSTIDPASHVLTVECVEIKDLPPVALAIPAFDANISNARLAA